MRHLPRFSCKIAPGSTISRVMVFLLVFGLLLLGPAGLAQPGHQPGQTATFDVSASVLADYQIQSYQIDCEITPDGLVRVQEKLDIRYEQDCEELEFVLDAGKARNLELVSVAISVRAATTDLDDQMVEVMPDEADSQTQMQSLSYKLSNDDALSRLKIRTIGEAGETRQVVVRYQLAGALVQLKDAIKFRRGFFNLAQGKPIANPILLIHYPADPDAGSPWFTAISPVPFVSAQVDQDTIQMSTLQLPARQNMTAAVIMPATGFTSAAALLPQGVVQDKAASIAEIEAEQARMTQRAWVKGFLDRLNWILMVAALFALTFLVLVFEREGLLWLPRHFREDEYLLKGPGYSPAILARLSRHHHPGQILLGTLMDLVLRGKLRLDGHVFTLKAHGLADYQGMTAFEIFLLQWFFERITQENTLSTAQIRRYALDRHTATEFSAYYEQFIILIQEDMVKAGLLDLHKKHLGKVIGLTLAAGYALASALITTTTGTLEGLILLLPAFLFVAFALGLKHLTRLGNIEAAKAGIFRQHLSHYARWKKNQAHNPALDCALLAPAVALGVARNYLHQLKALYGSNHDLISQFMAPLTKSLAGDAPNLADFARDLDAMGSMLSASLYLALGIHFYD